MMYQHATRDRDRVIALALGDLIRQAADGPDQASTGSQGEPLPAIGVARMWHERGATHRSRSRSGGAERLLTCEGNTRAGDGNRTRIASLEG